MLRVDEELLKRMTETIVRELAPEKIVLFGSHARGTADPGSDLDFLVVAGKPFSRHHSRKEEMMRLYRRFFDYDIPLDFLLFDQEEVKRWQSVENHVIAQALSEGRTLYERH